MGVILRQTIKSTIVFYIAALFGVVNRLFLLPNYLTPAEVGFIDNFVYLAVILSSLSMLGSQGSIAKFHTYFKTKNKYPNLIGKVLLISFIGFIFFCTLFFILKDTILSAFKEDFEILNEFYNLIPIFAFILILKTIFNNYSTTEKRITIPTILNDLWIKATILLLLLLIGFQYIHFPSYVYLLILSYFITTILMIIYCKKTLGLQISFQNKSNNTENKKILKYTSFIFLASFSGLITQFADSLMLGAYKGFTTSGIYSIAFFIGMSIEMPKRALSTISLPIISTYFDKNNLNEVNRLYKQSSINQGLIGLLLYLLIIINLDFIFSLIANSEVYSIGKYVTLIIGGAKVIDMFMGINNEILIVSKYYYLNLYLMIFLILITIGSNYILIPKYNLNGAALASLISIIFYNLIRFILLKKLYNFSPFSKNSIKLLLLFFSLILLNYFTPTIDINTKLYQFLFTGIKSISYILLFSIACYKLNISLEFNKIIISIYKKIIKNK